MEEANTSGQGGRPGEAHQVKRHLLILGLAGCALYNAHSSPGFEVLTPEVQAAEGAPVTRAVGRSRGAVRVDFRKVALREARRAGYSRPDLFLRQMVQESNLDPCAGSPAGAIGIAQILGPTARGWGVDPYDPHASLRAAARAMRKYEKSYGGRIDLSLAAYNAGPGAVAKYGNRIPDYPETKTYVARIMGHYPLPTGQMYTRPGGYTPEFRRRLNRLLRAGRGRFSVVPGNGYRSISDQRRLWNEAKRKYGSAEAARAWTAPPYCSNHGRGLSSDLRGDLELAHRLAPKYGLRFPMTHENWHVEMG